jgi:hypothetical protein
MKSIVLFVILVFTTSITAKDFKVYYLGGQSNMLGFGYNKELPDQLNKEFENIMIFNGNPANDNDSSGGKGLWTNLKPGHGFGFSSDGTQNNYSERFGLELSFAERLQELDPNSNIAIIKYSKGGTSLDYKGSKYGTWYPDYNDSTGINQYDHFLSCLRNSFDVRDIDNDGEADKLIPSGIIWMQGESDAYQSEFIAKRYLKNLTKMIELMRAAFRVDDLPVVIGRIADSGQDEDGKVMDYIKYVRDAQSHFTQRDVNAILIKTTDNYGWSDRWHYDSQGYLDLGKKFAEAIYTLNTSK